MKIRTKLIVVSALLFIPIIIMWSITDFLITNNTEEHAHEIIRFYASTFALTIGRGNTKEDKDYIPLFYRKDDLENYILDIEKIKKVDLVILDTSKVIIADVIQKNIGSKYSYSDVIRKTIKIGTEGTFKEYSKDYPQGISLYVCSIKNDDGQVIGALIMEYDNIITKLRANAESTQNTFIYSGIILLLILSLFGFLYSKMMTNCINKIVVAVRKFANGDYSARINSKRSDEIGEISDAFDQMVEVKKKNDEHIILLSNAIKSTNDMISITDSNAHFIFANEAFCKTYGYSKSEIIGKSVALITSEKNDYNYNNIYNPETFTEGWRGERWSKTKDSKAFIINLHLSPVRNNKGEFLGLIGVSNDITDKKLAEEALRISEEKFRLVFENIPVGITYADPSGRLINCNEVFLDIFNITKEEFQKFEMAQIEDHRLLEAFKLALSGIIGKYEGDYKSVVSKKVISLKVSFAPIISDGKVSGIVGIFEDISEIKQLERFFFHDILNTAGTLRSFVELLIDNTFEVKEKEEAFEHIFSISNQLIEEIVSHRSILTDENIKIKLNIENVNISEFLENISTNFKQISNSQNVKVVVNSESKNIKIKTDRTLLGRVVENLIKNAVEASNTGQEIRVGIRYENNQLIIDVYNESVIPLEIQSKIFQRSFSTKGGGRGIGTYSIKYLTENYLNGMVSFISNKENGTSFIVKIPAELEN